MNTHNNQPDLKGLANRPTILETVSEFNSIIIFRQVVLYSKHI